MAVFKTYDSVGIREDLANAIYDISPTTTPFMSTVGRSKSTNTYSEWQTDSLADVDLNNAQVEGADAVSGVLAPTTRVGNYTQISDKVIQVSTTDDKVDSAGRSTETAYQLSKASAEIKRDMESILLSDQAKDEGTSSTARKLGGLASWITTNVVDTTGVAPTEDNLKEAVLKAYTAGGEPTVLLVSPANKQVFSTFSGIAEQRFQAPGTGQTKIIGAADLYMSDFGQLSVVPDRFLSDDMSYVLDPSMASVSYLRPFKSQKLAKTGDNEKHLLNVEYTLKVNNEAAHAMMTDATPAE
tara:strand:- start:36 stop:929 length:894 start_codon:yes stop_codon:yes gene_type:complete